MSSTNHHLNMENAINSKRDKNVIITFLFILSIFCLIIIVYNSLGNPIPFEQEKNQINTDMDSVFIIHKKLEERLLMEPQNYRTDSLGKGKSFIKDYSSIEKHLKSIDNQIKKINSIQQLNITRRTTLPNITISIILIISISGLILQLREIRKMEYQSLQSELKKSTLADEKKYFKLNVYKNYFWLKENFIQSLITSLEEFKTNLLKFNNIFDFKPEELHASVKEAENNLQKQIKTSLEKEILNSETILDDEVNQIVKSVFQDIIGKIKKDTTAKHEKFYKKTQESLNTVEVSLKEIRNRDNTKIKNLREALDKILPD